MSSDDDERFMAVALRLAARGLGLTAPNPSVGAVIVTGEGDNAEVIARGWTQPGGRPHAETEALRRAGARARGATMIVTLEPCSHHGKTPPCSDAIIAAGIARVVCGVEDPDPRVAGRGLDHLRAAGIAVTRGVLSDAVHWVTRGHLVRVAERRPFVQLKLALASDGSVPRGGSGQPAWVSSPAARARGHLLRAEADAILVGGQTVFDDDPELTCRLPGLAQRSPIRIVLSRAADLPLASKLVATARTVPVLVYHAPNADPARIKALAERGVTTVAVVEVGDGLWLPAVLEDLAARGITRLLVEGGPGIWRSFSRAGFVDEVVAVLAREPGRPAPPISMASALVSSYIDLGRMTWVEHVVVGESDDIFTLRRKVQSPTGSQSGTQT